MCRRELCRVGKVSKKKKKNSEGTSHVSRPLVTLPSRSRLSDQSQLFLPPILRAYREVSTRCQSLHGERVGHHSHLQLRTPRNLDHTSFGVGGWDQKQRNSKN